MCFSVDARADDYRKLITEGNRLYEEGNYDEALNKYREAQIERPEAGEIQYNIGSTLYRQGAFKESAEIFPNATTTDDSRLEAHTYYNQGNAFFRQQDYPQAIEAYKQALKLNPEDEDAKFNLELARKKLKEQMKPQQQQQQQQQQKEQQQQNEQQQQDQEQNQQQQDKQQQQQQQQQDEQNQQQQQQDEQEQQQQQQRAGEQDESGADSTQQQPAQAQAMEGMTKEDAERILDALKDEEQRLQKEKRRAQTSRSSSVIKDW